MPLIVSYLNPWFPVLFEEIMKPLCGAVLLKEARHREWSLSLYNLNPVPVSSLLSAHVGREDLPWASSSCIHVFLAFMDSALWYSHKPKLTLPYVASDHSALSQWQKSNAYTRIINLSYLLLIVFFSQRKFHDPAYFVYPSITGTIPNLCHALNRLPRWLNEHVQTDSSDNELNIKVWIEFLPLASINIWF